MDEEEFESYASESDWKMRCKSLEEALTSAMVLLGDADDKYGENLLDSLFDSDELCLDFYNRNVAG